MGRWFGSEHTSCPNCGAEDEDLAHLLHCTNPGRFACFREEVKKLAEWMQSSHTDPDLARMIPKYLLQRGSVTLSSMAGRSREIMRTSLCRKISLGGIISCSAWCRCTSVQFNTPICWRPHQF
jgi:hypothetical protein